MHNILAACLGILLLARLSSLPPLPTVWWQWFALLLPALLLLHRFTRPLGAFALGLLWAAIAGHQLLARQLPPELEGEELLIRGVISGLPEPGDGYLRFEFTVEHYLNLRGDDGRALPLPERILLSWYGREQLGVGERWTLKVKLRRPRGLVNEGGFDYQRYLLSDGIGATGYVRPSTRNAMHGLSNGHPIERLREGIRDWLLPRVQGSSGGLLVALAVGDSSGIAPAQWDLLRRTGTSHLMAISGLHIGLAALLGYWCGRVLAALLSLCLSRTERVGDGLRRGLSTFGYALPALFSCLLALVYSGLAGFALPTQRAMVMVLLFNLAMLSRRNGSALRALAWAMLIVLLLDPLAGESMGFWLSFGAVAVLLYSFRRRQLIAAQHYGHRVAAFGRAQFVVFLGLTLPLLALNQPQSLTSPLANALAIPLVSFLVVAPLLAAIMLKSWMEPLAEWAVQLAAFFMNHCLAFLEALDQAAPLAGWFPSTGQPGSAAIVFALLAILLILAPRGIPGRWLGLVLLLPLFAAQRPPRPPLEINVLDVGQGLAVVVMTPAHVLVYDTGPAYSESFNAGEAVILPFLRSRGINGLDRLIISHGDGDHVGGALGLLAGVPVAELLSGETVPGIAALHPTLPIRPCAGDQQWRWGEVDFQMIAPAGQRIAGGGNNSSCILLIEYAGRRILLPGDVEAPVEAQLLAANQLPRDLDLLLAPHHGSATSSTTVFVERLRPHHVVYSAAYHSPYGHPHPDVQVRYAQVGSEAHHTGRSGQLRFTWDGEGELAVAAWREHRRRYWFDHF